MSGVIKANLGGKERSLKFGTNSTAHYCEIRGCDLDGYIKDIAKFILSQADNNKIKSLSGLKGSESRYLIYSGLWAFDITKNNSVDQKQIDVGDWIDDVDQKELNKILQTLFNYNNGKVKPETTKEKGVKKK